MHQANNYHHDNHKIDNFLCFTKLFILFIVFDNKLSVFLALYTTRALFYCFMRIYIIYSPLHIENSLINRSNEASVQVFLPLKLSASVDVEFTPSGAFLSYPLSTLQFKLSVAIKRYERMLTAQDG